MKELLQMALDALIYHRDQTRPIERSDSAIAALREAIAAPQPEPVAYGMQDEHGVFVDAISPEEQRRYPGEYKTPLYAAPPAAPAPAVPEGDVVVSWNEDGQIVAVTRQDREGRILSVIAESAAPVVREPLTREQIAKALASAGLKPEDYRKDGLIEPLVWAIEQAHGIGGGGK